VLSVIIATRESERALVRTLAVLVAGAAAGAVREVIVADGASTDATAEVADIAGCRLLTADAPAGVRLKAAAATARAPWLLFLQPGTVLDVTWIDDVMDFVTGGERRDVAGRRAVDGKRAASAERAAVFRPLADMSGQRSALAEALSLLRVALGARPRPHQGLLIAKALYDEIGGHRDHADSEADLLRRLGGRRILMLRSGAARADG
jgi:glycosyl transferase family 2